MFALYFFGQLCFVNEAQRISNQTAGWAFFISCLFSALAYISVHQRLRKAAQKPAEVKVKDNRLYTKDKGILNDQLKNSLRRELVEERMRRKLEVSPEPKPAVKL